MPQNPFGDSFEDAFEQGVSTSKKAVGNQVKVTAQAVASQIVGQKSHQAAPTDAGTPQADTTVASDPMNETNTQQQHTQHSSQDPHLNPLQIEQLEKQKEAEAEQKLEAARRKLHAEYFKNLTTPKPEPSKQEKLEREEQEEQQKKMAKLEEQKKKDEPIALSRAKRTAEMNRGASG